MKFTKETFKLMIRTFLQAFVPCLIVGFSAIDFTVEKSVWKPAVVSLAASAVSAGTAAVMNLKKPE